MITHDLFGNHVDGWYWQLTEESFEEQVEAFQSGPQLAGGGYRRETCRN